MSPPFDRSVFVNCPFDEEFAPILQAIAFAIVDLGFVPRIAPENPDNAANRLDRITELVRGSKFSIHDLSRCKSRGVGEFSRLNMPFELGIDFGCKRYGDGQLADKTMLILEEDRWDYQKALSDISGWDIHSHGGSHINAVKRVRDWLVRQAGLIWSVLHVSLVTTPIFKGGIGSVKDRTAPMMMIFANIPPIR